MKNPRGLTDKRWRIINFLRDCYKRNKIIPTVYGMYGTDNIELEELEQLFPDGYYRGEIEIAGLRVRQNCFHFPCLYRNASS